MKYEWFYTYYICQDTSVLLFVEYFRINIRFVVFLSDFKQNIKNKTNK